MKDKWTTAPGGGIAAAYRRQLQRKAFWLAGLTGLTLAVGVFAVGQGAYDLSPLRVLQALVGRAPEAADVVVWKIRLPRILAAVVSGWGLSLAGLGIQTLLKNPLGSPSTLGISQGAAFGAALAIVVFGAGVFSVTAFAFAGAMGATLIILTLARIRQLSPEAIILAGVALSSLFASATILVQYLATETELAVVVFWTFGDVARSNWGEIGLVAAVSLMTMVYLLIRRWDLNALTAGEEAAKGLGTNVARVRLQGMLAAALVAAMVTAFHGVIAFVGLIAPHLARCLVGEENGLLIPFSAILGALLLLLADTVGRVLIGSGALPVGVVTSFMGAPMFLFLLVRGRR
jgi:iron complex transport system permease protein